MEEEIDTIKRLKMNVKGCLNTTDERQQLRQKREGYVTLWSSCIARMANSGAIPKTPAHIVV